MDYNEDPRMQYAMQASVPGQLTHVPLRIQLLEHKKHHQKEVERITQLIELMDKNPAIEQFVNLQRGFL